MKNLFRVLILVFVFSTMILLHQSTSVRAACGGVIYVDAHSTASTPDGCSWGNAFPSLQDALALAASGDQIWVAQGVYYPDRGAGQTPGDRNSAFIINKNIAVYGGFTGAETALDQRNPDPATNNTVLSGDIGVLGDATDNAYHVVKIYAVSELARLDGFTVSGGYTLPLSTDNFGAGVAITDASPSLVNLRIQNNRAYRGGGMFITSNSVPVSKPVLTNIVFTGNVAEAGGGVLSQNSDPILHNVIFENNSATAGAGGGMNVQSINDLDPPNQPMFTDVIFRNNTAVGGGGLILGNANGYSELNNVAFVGNTASRRGGALLIEFSSPTLRNVTFYNNQSLDTTGNAEGGGAIRNVDSSPILINVTFSGNNSVSIGGDAIRNSGASSPVIRNSILWDADDEILEAGATTIAYSIVKGGCPAGAACANVLTGDPLLGALQDNGGFAPTMAITSASPAWNAGENAFCPASDGRGVVRPQAYYCDLGAYELEVAYPFLASPQGVQTTWDHVFRWAAKSGATNYQLAVQQADGAPLFTRWYSAAQLGCADDTTCDIAPAELNALPNGDYRWRVQDYSPATGYGAWSAFTNFSLNGACFSLTLSVNPAGKGSLSATPPNCGGGYTYGTTVKLTLTPYPGYVFTGWSGDAAGTTNPLSVVMDGDKSVTANLRGVSLIAPEGELSSWSNLFQWVGAAGGQSYQLEVSDAVSGVVLYRKWLSATATNCAGDSSCEYSPVELGGLANGSYRWRVQDWGAYGYGVWTGYKTFTLNAPCYTLTTGANPAGSGTVSVSPAPNCGSGYTAGTVVQARATPNAGYVFTGWSGDAAGTANPLNVVMDGDKSVTANLRGVSLIAPEGELSSWSNLFQWVGAAGGQSYQLEVSDAVSGVVLYRKWLSATATNCAGDSSCEYSPVELGGLANGSYRWRVQDWGAYGYGVWTGYKTFTLNAPCYTLTTGANPAGGGTVSVSPAPNCGSGYTAGTVVQARATPNAGYVFTGWGGDAAGTANPLNVVMDGDKSVTANLRGITLQSPSGELTAWENVFRFTGNLEASLYLLRVEKADGTLVHFAWYTPAQAGCAGGTDCALSPAELAGLANGSYRWKMRDYVGGSYGPFTPYMEFTLNVPCYTLTTGVNPAGSGTVSVSPAPNCPGGYTAGTVVQVRATPNAGYVFTGWSGDAAGTANPLNVVMDGDKSVTANLRGITLQSPSGELTAWENVFRFTGNLEASLYLLRVEKADGTLVHFAWYTPAQAGCAGGTDCALSPAGLAGLANGSYRWKMRDYVGGSYGPFTPYMEFTLNR